MILGLATGQIRSAQVGDQSYKHTREKLRKLVSVRLDSDKLASLFKIGDKRIVDLIQALDDADRNVSLSAQVVIRYLGNEQGMKSLCIGSA